MNDSFFVGRLETFRNVHEERQGVIDGHGAWDKALRQRFSLDELHYEKLPTFGLFKSMDGGDVRVVQRRQKAGFALEACQAVFIVRERRRKDFRATSRPSLMSRAM